MEYFWRVERLRYLRRAEGGDYDMNYMSILGVLSHPILPPREGGGGYSKQVKRK